MNVFVYGTLLVPSIWEAVTGEREIPWSPAELSGHLVRKVRGAVYPGMVEEAGAPLPVPGKVYRDVPVSALARLDAYEGEIYLRAGVHPVTQLWGQLPAQAYLIPRDRADLILSPEPWTIGAFEELDLAAYWDRHFGSCQDPPPSSSRQSPSST